MRAGNKSTPPSPQPTIGTSLDENVAWIQQEIGGNTDLDHRRFLVLGKHRAVLFYFYTLIDQQLVNEDILKPFMRVTDQDIAAESAGKPVKELIADQLLYFNAVKFVKEKDQILSLAMRGDALVFVDGMDEAMLIGCRKVDKRSIDQPKTEVVIRGPREGFIELLETNISLLRYRLPTKSFRVEIIEIGKRTKTKVAVCYIEDIADPNIVKEVKRRLSNIEIDGIMDSGYLEHFVQDSKFSPFPQVQYTERPDKVTANLLEGRVGLLSDGSPMALIVPTVFSQFYQTVEDYTERFLLMSAIRLARLLAILFSLVFPSLYVAIISFNPELIPTDFAVAVSGGRSGIPFPAVIEVLIMEVSMEVLREASVRLPVQIAGALSIVGTLIIGQAAVSAGFSSPITVVIIALATIGSYATPAYNAALALRLLRFPIIILAGTFGLFGIVIALIFIVNHMLSLKSLGVPYLTPFVPTNLEGLKDMVFRAPLFMMKRRPSFLHPQDDTRAGSNSQSPHKESRS